MGFKKVLGKILPVAASVATSGVLGPGVAKSLTGILKLGSNPSDADIEKALATASPEQYVELHRLEADTKRQALEADLQLAELEVERERIHQEDRDSARKREMAVGDKTPSIFAWVALGGFLGLLALISIRGMPDDKSEPLIYVGLTALGTILTQVAAYYFGSSAGSKEKTQALGKALGARTVV